MFSGVYDLTTCCSRHQGNDSGDWYAPGSENRLPLESEKEDSAHAIYEYRGNQSVTLVQRSTTVSQPAGIYRCDIAVSGSSRGTVYVGLYETGGIHYLCSLKTSLRCKYTFHYVQEILRYHLSLDSILTCVSTGGPATNVTWTRGNDEVNLILVDLLDNAQVTVLENAITAQYSHTLNVTGTDLPAVYGCSVSNNKPSSAKAIASIVINVQVFPNKTYIAHELFSLFLSLYTCRYLKIQNLHFHLSIQY